MADLFLGIDVGTSGARVVVIDGQGALQSEGRSAMADHGPNHRSPAIWWAATQAALQAALRGVVAGDIAALAVDGTSGTMLAVTGAGQPLADGLMYNDPCTDAALLARIAALSPQTTAARGATSGLARAVELARSGTGMILHQADWIAGQIGGPLVTDENNALKTGYDPVSGTWPDWVAQVIDLSLLPPVLAAGVPAGRVGRNEFGLSPDCLVVAGTTDGCASFLATGASGAGEGATVLGTTLTLKMLSDRPVFAPDYGIYSHKVLGLWLAGGASNTGGNVLVSEFPGADLAALSAQIDPETDTGLAYYPLPGPGERFPVNDPGLMPVMGPRPASDAEHMKAIFEGIAGIEALAYRRLTLLGAPPLASVRTLGGGAANAVWTRIRARRLGVAMPTPLSGEAAYGTALLARHGAGRA